MTFCTVTKAVKNLRLNFMEGYPYPLGYISIQLSVDLISILYAHNIKHKGNEQILENHAFIVNKMCIVQFQLKLN